MVGVCGPFDVPTPVIRYSELPLPEDPNINLVHFDGDSQVRVYDRQMFVEMSMTEAPEIPADGQWDSVQECPVGSVIIGGKISTAGRGGVLTGMKIKCGHILALKKGYRYEKDGHYLNITGLRAEEYIAELSKPGDQQVAVGFRVKVTQDGHYQYDLAYERDAHFQPGLFQNTCPPSYAVCGIEALISQEYGDNFLNN